MRAAVFSKQLTASNAAVVAAAQTLGAAGSFALVGGGTVTLDTARRVALTSVGNDSGLTFTLAGTDYAGNAISETLSGTNAGVAQSLRDYLTITSARSSGATAANVSVGTTTVGSTPWCLMSNHVTPVEIGLGLQLLSGAATATIEMTDDGPLSAMGIYLAGQTMTPPIPLPIAWPSLNQIALALNTPQSSVIDRPVAAVRLTINSGTGKVQATFREAGITQGA